MSEIEQARAEISVFEWASFKKQVQENKHKTNAELMYEIDGAALTIYKVLRLLLARDTLVTEERDSLEQVERNINRLRQYLVDFCSEHDWDIYEHLVKEGGKVSE